MTKYEIIHSFVLIASLVLKAIRPVRDIKNKK